MKKLIYILPILVSVLMYTACDDDEPVIEELKVEHSVEHVSERDGNDGSITLTVTGGKEPFSFLWSSGQTSKDISGLIADTYTYTVTDAAGQTASSTVEVLEGLIVTFETNNTTARGASDGSIVLTVTGGQEPISFAWSNGESTSTITDLAAGLYSVTVSDISEEVVVSDIEISDPEIKTKTDSVIMGAGYANDIYFSLKNGIVSSTSRTAWDLGFYTNPQSSSIITNDGNGIKLYVWPNGGIEDWANVDTTGFASWTALFNTYSDSTWQNGAFDKGGLGHPDYGWGVYDMNTHNVFGDSVHIVVFADGSAKKLIIENRDAMSNTFNIKHADIDGSNEVSATINAGEHLDKNIIHYSITSNSVIAQEPASETWDLLFTKYYDESIPYIVTGVLTNNGIGVAEQANTDTASHAFSDAEYVYSLNTIGSDWKTFSMDVFSYIVTEDLVYFVKDKEDNYFKIVFTAFDYSNGKFNYVISSY